MGRSLYYLRLRKVILIKKLDVITQRKSNNFGTIKTTD